MKGKTVEQSDLIGKIENFPIEVVQMMVDEQVRQGNKADVKVFQLRCKAPVSCGGFVWARADDGFNFWDEVISRENFDLFFSKYPKTQSSYEQNSVSIKVPDGYEIDNEKSTFTNIVFKPIDVKCPKSWEDAFAGNPICGYWIGAQSDTIESDGNAADCDKNIFKTEKQAKSALAYAQITQLMALPCYNGDWIPDWENRNEEKYFPYRANNIILSGIVYAEFQHVAFKSQDIYKAFIENHEDLLRQYFEMD